ncbi:hypothetical protein, partial [Frankia sp. AgKG'84/4]|uniref:hypothetical protein n=1 Tax=Frankia sp. AgKG'84/4 TaxID=573490 RepID=UPI00202AB884
ACSGCGESPYLKLLSQLFGDRILVARKAGNGRVRHLRGNSRDRPGAGRPRVASLVARSFAATRW